MNHTPPTIHILFVYKTMRQTNTN